MNDLTNEQLALKLPYLSAWQRRIVLALIEGTIKPSCDIMFPKTHDWIRQCYNRPSTAELIISALNEVTDGHGVEAIVHNEKICADYVNMGDTYDPTIIRVIDTGEYLLCSWGDYLEQLEAEKSEE